MKLVTLSNDKIKYSINDDGTLIIKIEDEYLLKISWGEIRSLDMIISEQQSEAVGLAKEMIERLKKGLDSQPKPIVEETTIVELNEDESPFNRETKTRFLRFLESYLSKDDETVEVFDSEEVRSVLGQEFLLTELSEEFGDSYAFKELDNERISVALLL